MSPGSEKYAEFIRLLTGHQASLLGYIFALVLNWSDAEDLLQQTSLFLWEKFDDFRPGSDFGRWAATVARNKVMNFLKAKGRDRIRLSTEVVELLAAQGEDSLDSWAAERKALSDCLAELPARERQTLMNYYSGKMTVKGLAEKRGVTIHGIYKWMSRLRDALLNCIERKLAMEGLQ